MAKAEGNRRRLAEEGQQAGGSPKAEVFFEEYEQLSTKIFLAIGTPPVFLGIGSKAPPASQYGSGASTWNTTTNPYRHGDLFII
jgi:hypothetical protein